MHRRRDGEQPGNVPVDGGMESEVPLLDPLLRVSTYESYTFETMPDPIGSCLKKLCEFIESPLLP